MAQERSFAGEEFECQSPPEAPVLCANNCGFFGNCATMDLCSKCYRDTVLLVGGGATIATATPANVAAITATPAAVSVPPATASVTAAAHVASPSTSALRCSSCRKRVGLTGFKCRCGNVFCGTHRYSDRHDCGFDYKSQGRDAIAKANPVVVASKIHKI